MADSDLALLEPGRGGWSFLARDWVELGGVEFVWSVGDEGGWPEELAGVRGVVSGLDAGSGCWALLYHANGVLQVRYWLGTRRWGVVMLEPRWRDLDFVRRAAGQLLRMAGSGGED